MPEEKIAPEFKKEREDFLISKEYLANQLNSLKHKLINLWNKVQPDSAKSYNVVHRLDVAKSNLFQLSDEEHQHLSFILSVLIQIAEDLKPSFSDSKPPEGWISYDDRQTTADFSVTILETVPRVVISQLHVELINFSIHKNKDHFNFTATSIMNGLLTLFIQSFERVEQEGITAVKRFCHYLIPADSDHACIDARTRMAFNFAMSEEMSPELFSDIMYKAHFDESYFSVLAYIVQNYWGKYLKADTGTNAVCTPKDLGTYGKRISATSYGLIKKGISSVFCELGEPGIDFVFWHKNLDTPQKKFDFFALVLKEPQCIKLLADIDKTTDEYAEWQKAFDELILTRNPLNGKNLLGFAVKDCKANDYTLSRLLENLSDSAFKKAIVDAGVIWVNGVCSEVVSRLKKLNQLNLAEFIEQAPLFIKNETLNFYGELLQLKNLREEMIFSMSQAIFPLLNNSIRFIETIDHLKAYLSKAALLTLVYYSGAFKSYLEIEGEEGLNDLKKILFLFDSSQESDDGFTTQEKNIFDSIMNIYSEFRGKNFFGLLVGHLGVLVPSLLKRMSLNSPFAQIFMNLYPFV